MIAMIMIIGGYLVLGATCVAWQGQYGRSNGDLADLTSIAILLLWPAWVLAFVAHSYGWRHR